MKHSSVVVTALALALVTVLPTQVVEVAASWVDQEQVTGAVAVRVPRDCTLRGRYDASAQARLLSGTALGTDLDLLAAASAVQVQDAGSGAVPFPVSAVSSGPDAFRLPLVAGTLQAALPADLAAALLVDAAAGTNGLLQQWARAASDGETAAAVGAVDSSGAQVPTPGSPTLLVLDLGRLAPSVTALAGLRLEVGALSAAATVDACLVDEGQATPVGSYTIAGLRLEADSAALAALRAQANTAVQAANTQVVATEALLAAALSDVTAGLLGVPVTGATADVSIDLSTVLSALLDQTLDDGVVAVDLRNGTVTVDLAQLVAGGLNGRPPSTALLTDPALFDTVATRVTALLDTWRLATLSAADAALRAAPVVVTTRANVPLVGTVTVTASGTVAQLLAGTGQVTSSPIAVPGLAGAAQAALAPVLTQSLLAGVGTTLDTPLSAAVPAVGPAVASAFAAVGGVLGVVVNAQAQAPAEHALTVTAVQISIPADAVSLRLATASTGPTVVLP